MPEDANGPIDGYVIRFKRIKSGSEILYENSSLLTRNVSGNSITYRLDMLKPWSTYSVEISSYNVLKGEHLYSKKNEELIIKTEVDSKYHLYAKEVLNCFHCNTHAY